MKTKHKILIAKITFNLISIIRRKQVIRIKKNDINWELDLSIPDGTSNTLVAK
tara:strand:+ start:174 stop:332 length:159 start_codon:yes stop_codon:yes gene_type:complete